MFEGFRTERIEVDGVGIHARIGGEGPPLLLLHGYPQTHVIWHKIVARLAERFTVVATDLRGYGDSDCPPTDADHAPYSKRAMAADQVGVMAALGFERFRVVGHDRGGRVAHRLARDHGERVEKLAVLDIAPTATMYGATDMTFATAYYHWFFLIQPHDFPERLIGADPEYYLTKKCLNWGRTQGAITEAAFAEYLRCFRRPEVIHASCEDYRAAAGIDLVHDGQDTAKLAMPVLALWGRDGFVGGNYDVVATWEAVANDVTGVEVPGGHYVAEEAPEETLAALLAFL